MSSEGSSKCLPLPDSAEQGTDEGVFPEQARFVLEESLLTSPTLMPTPDVAALSMIGGYLARTVKENIDCDRCLLLLVKPPSYAPVDRLILHQDRGGAPVPIFDVSSCPLRLEEVYRPFWTVEEKKATEPPKASRQESRECAFRAGQAEMCQSWTPHSSADLGVHKVLPASPDKLCTFCQ
ncbi:hypothetical protein HPB48_026959 [Haemaphysalis longicornis]|uniref:Uncharacterized protein n=1 Tax=Haemaphysalis longicornis TaxID=44386 RepID=A0A9J6HCS7_HAELO|nr:hypothetical protein HPB48_026959 [Haemaphysalis longicornis]